MPRIECRGERRFIGFGEREYERPQFSSCISLWPARQILRHLLDLVELAYLHRNTLENVEETTPSVHDGGKKCPAPFFENASSVPVVRHALTLHFMPPDVFLQVRGAEDADAVVLAPECRVSNRDSRLWYAFRRFDDNAV